MNLNKNCPFQGTPCNTDCALIVAHGHENYRTQRYDYTYTCGLVEKGAMTRFTDDMKVVE